MSRRVFGPIAVASYAALMAAIPADVQARNPVEYMHGALCNPKTATDFTRVDYGQYGVHNISSIAAATVECGVQFKLGLNQRLFVVAYDRHPTQDVCCTGMAVDMSGNALNTAQACTSDAASAAKLLDVNFVDTGSSLVFMECSIPPRTSNGYSHVASYRIP